MRFLRMPLALVIAGGLVATLSLARPAASATVGFEFSGTVTYFQDILGDLDGSVAAGSTFTGRMLWESTSADWNPDPTRGFYSGSAPAFVLEVQVGSYAFSASNVDVLVRNDDGIIGDDLDVRNSFTEAFPGDPLLQIDILGLWFGDSDETVLSSDALPTGSLDLSEFESRGMRIYGCQVGRIRPEGNCSNNDWDIQGTVGSLVFVPEPGTALLLASGLLGLGVVRASRSTSGASRSSEPPSPSAPRSC